jgi:anti-sigma-K factor RsiG
VSEKPFTPSDGFDWESSEDLTVLPESELEELLSRVLEEERLAAYRREVLRGRANLIRAELAGRGVAGLSTEELARVLLGEAGEGRPV